MQAKYILSVNEFDNTLWSQNWGWDLTYIMQRGKLVGIFNPVQKWHPAWGILSDDGKSLTVKFGDITLVGTVSLYKSDIILHWSNSGVWRRIPSDKRVEEYKLTYENNFLNYVNSKKKMMNN